MLVISFFKEELSYLVVSNPLPKSKSGIKSELALVSFDEPSAPAFLFTKGLLLPIGSSSLSGSSSSSSSSKSSSLSSLESAT